MLCALQGKLKPGELLHPNAYALFRRWQRAMLSGSKPCGGQCGRMISMNSHLCRECGERAASVTNPAMVGA